MSAPSAPEPATDPGNAIDLGSPVYESPSPSAGPLSGAAFVAWSSRLNRMVKPLGTEGPRSHAAAEGAAAEEGSAMIDLGDPVTNPVGDKGPPSGASFVAWSSLAKKKAEQAAAAGAPVPAPPTVAATQPRTVATPSTTKVVPPAAAGNAHYGWLALGVALGVALSVALWAAGFEPPQGLRHWHQPAAPSQP